MARTMRPDLLRIDRLRVELFPFMSVPPDECRMNSAHQTRQTGIAAQEHKKRRRWGKAPPEGQRSELLDDHRRAGRGPAIEAGHRSRRDVDASVGAVFDVRAGAVDGS